MDKIDVFIATKDSEDTIDKTLQSLLDAEIPINRIVVVDASKTLITVTKIAEWCKEHDIPREIRFQTGKTLGNARQQGLEMVQTNIYASIDSDVILDKGWYNKLYKIMNAKHVLVASGFLYFGNKGSLLYGFNQWKKDNAIFHLSLGNCLINVENLIRIGGYADYQCNEDTELLERMKIDGRYTWVLHTDVDAYNPRDWKDDLKQLVWYGNNNKVGWVRVFMRCGGGVIYGIRLGFTRDIRYLVYLPFRMFVWFLAVLHIIYVD